VAKTAVIFGVSGQDGSYLAELLLAKGYTVVGVVRPGSGTGNLKGIKEKLVFETLDMDDPGFCGSMLDRHRPDEVYNLAAQSHVGESWDRLVETVEAGAMLPARIISAIHKAGGGIKYFQASTGAIFGGTMFGNAQKAQTEDTPIDPRDPYAAAKYLPHRLVGMYRERYGYHFCSGILYNHESPRRPESFVTRKITRAAARISLGSEDKLRLGSLDSVRDWGYAPDYVKGIWMMVQSERPDDYILATGVGHTVREFVETAFSMAGLDWTKHVVVDDALIRSNDGVMVGDPSKIAKELGWRAETSFEEMVRIMVEADITDIKKEA
jgi:GDPmannose 4,6-dehydratase